MIVTLIIITIASFNRLIFKIKQDADTLFKQALNIESELQQLYIESWDNIPERIITPYGTEQLIITKQLGNKSYDFILERRAF